MIWSTQGNTGVKIPSCLFFFFLETLPKKETPERKIHAMWHRDPGVWGHANWVGRLKDGTNGIAGFVAPSQTWLVAQTFLGAFLLTFRPCTPFVGGTVARCLRVRGPRRSCGTSKSPPRTAKGFYKPRWSWVKIQVVPPVNIPIPTTTDENGWCTYPILGSQFKPPIPPGHSTGFFLRRFFLFLSFVKDPQIKRLTMWGLLKVGHQPVARPFNQFTFPKENQKAKRYEGVDVNCQHPSHNQTR